jgi:alanyl-tRNA synthetase
MTIPAQDAYHRFRGDMRTGFAEAGCPELHPQPLAHPTLKTNFTMSMALTLRDAQEVATPDPLVHRRSVIQPCIRVHDTLQVLEDADPWHLTLFEMGGAFSNGATPRKSCLEIFFQVLNRTMGLTPDRLLFEPYAGGGTHQDAPDTPTIEMLRRCGAREDRIRPRTTAFFGFRKGEKLLGPLVEVSAEVGSGTWREIATIVFLDLMRTDDGGTTANPRPFAEFGIGVERAICIREGRSGLDQCAPLGPLMDVFRGFSQRNRLLAADRLRAAVFAVSEGIRPARGGRRSILRHFFRDIASIDSEGPMEDALQAGVRLVLETYSPYYPLSSLDEVLSVIRLEYEHERQRRNTKEKKPPRGA